MTNTILHKITKTKTSIALLLLSLSIASCAVSNKTAGQHLDDTVLLVKVENALRAHSNEIPSSSISVHTHGNTVQLSGFVDTHNHKASAETIARRVAGVDHVINSIVVKDSAMHHLNKAKDELKKTFKKHR